MDPTTGRQRTAIVIRAGRGWAPLNVAEMWQYHELLYFLAWRDIKVRYKQTVLGIAWAVFQPSCLTLIFAIFFGRLGGLPSDGIPYPLFALCGLLPWQLFAQALTNSAISVVANERLITKIYFPRLIIPLSAAISAVIDFFFGLLLLFGLMAYYGIAPTRALWALPAFVLLVMASAVGVGLWFAALNVAYRDVRYVTPFVIQFWFFISPVAYPASLVPGKWRLLYNLNPMAGAIQGFRWALVGGRAAPDLWLAMSALATMAVLIAGVYYFRRLERNFADVV